MATSVEEQRRSEKKQMGIRSKRGNAYALGLTRSRISDRGTPVGQLR